MSFFENSVFFGVTISIVAYGVGCVLKDKLKMDIFNPVLISIVAVIAVLACAHIDYDVYYSGAQYLSYLLTPATVCLAVPLYEKIELLKEHWKAIVAGILSGVLTTLLCVLAMSLIFGFSHEEYVTFLPKSITTAIGMGVSEELGGYVTITVAIIIITGVLGNIVAPFVCKAFRIQDPSCQRNCNRYGVPCDRYFQSYGNGRDRRSDEQSVNCGIGTFNCSRRIDICTVYIR